MWSLMNAEICASTISAALAATMLRGWRRGPALSAAASSALRVRARSVLVLTPASTPASTSSASGVELVGLGAGVAQSALEVTFACLGLGLLCLEFGEPVARWPGDLPDRAHRSSRAGAMPARTRPSYRAAASCWRAASAGSVVRGGSLLGGWLVRLERVGQVVSARSPQLARQRFALERGRELVVASFLQRS